MAYTPKTWECNETITAEDLNHMEQGIAEASSGGGGDTPTDVITKNNFIIFSGTATNVPGNDAKTVNILSVSELAEYGITNNDDVEVVSVSQTYGSTKSFFSRGALSPGSGVPYSYTYPRAMLSIAQESGQANYGLQVAVCNFYSGSQADIDYRVVLLKLPSE